MDQWLAYVFLGLLCGILSATIGIGSGIILVPVLVLLFQFPQKSAQGICLAAMVPMALAGALRYKFNPQIEVDLRIVAWLAVGGVVGALIGSSIAGALSGGVLRKLLAVGLLVAAARMITASPPARKTSNDLAPATVLENDASNTAQDTDDP